MLLRLEDYVSLFLINVGTSDAEEPGHQLVKLAKIHEHPSFNVVEINYNLVILEFEEPVVFGPGIQPAVLPEEGEIVEVNAEGFGLGYGCTNDMRLNKVNIKVISEEECKNGYEQADESIFCGALTEEIEFCGVIFV